MNEYRLTNSQGRLLPCSPGATALPSCNNFVLVLAFIPFLKVYIAFWRLNLICGVRMAEGSICFLTWYHLRAQGLLSVFIRNEYQQRSPGNLVFTMFKKFRFLNLKSFFFLVFWRFPLLSCELSYAFQLNNIYYFILLFIFILLKDFRGTGLPYYWIWNFSNFPFFTQCTTAQQVTCPRSYYKWNLWVQTWDSLPPRQYFPSTLGWWCALFPLEGSIDISSLMGICTQRGQK